MKFTVLVGPVYVKVTGTLAFANATFLLEFLVPGVNG
jgi:hypothetical protein